MVDRPRAPHPSCSSCLTALRAQLRQCGSPISQGLSPSALTCQFTCTHNAHLHLTLPSKGWLLFILKSLLFQMILLVFQSRIGPFPPFPARLPAYPCPPPPSPYLSPPSFPLRIVCGHIFIYFPVFLSWMPWKQGVLDHQLLPQRVAHGWQSINTLVEWLTSWMNAAFFGIIPLLSYFWEDYFYQVCFCGSLRRVQQADKRILGLLCISYKQLATVF